MKNLYKRNFSIKITKTLTQREKIPKQILSDKNFLSGSVAVGDGPIKRFSCVWKELPSSLQHPLGTSKQIRHFTFRITGDCSVKYVQHILSVRFSSILINICLKLPGQTETEAVKKQYVKIQDAYGSLGVLQINAGNSSVQYLVLITGIYSVGKIADIEIFRITQTQFVPLQYQQVNEDRAGEVILFPFVFKCNLFELRVFTGKKTDKLRNILFLMG